MDKAAKILIVGHDDIIEKSLVEYYTLKGFKNIYSTTTLGLNAAIQASVYEFFATNKPHYVFLGSVRSGGIQANQEFAADFIYHNLESQNNIIYAAHKFGVRKLLYFASSCVYPRDCEQPIKEESLLVGALEETSEPYSVAKIAGIKLCQAYRKQYGFNAIVMVPATVYGPASNKDLNTAHVIGALIGKFQDALQRGLNEVEVWGSGRPRREFLFVNDFVDACHFLMEHYDESEIINVGVGEDISIIDLAHTIAQDVGYHGNIRFDPAKPDGTMRKLLDNSRIKNLGWNPKVNLQEGIRKLL